jgi:hypothetical protein
MRRHLQATLHSLLVSSLRRAILFGAAVLPLFTARADWTPLNISSNLSINVLAHDGSALYAGTSSGLFRTTTEGDSWEQLSDGLTWGLGALPSVLSILISGDTVLVGTDGHGLYCSVDAGASFQGNGNAGIGTKVFALHAVHGVVYAGTEQGLYMSGDNGATWTMVEAGLPAAPLSVSCIGSTGDTLIIGTRGGVSDGTVMHAHERRFDRHECHFDFDRTTHLADLHGANWGLRCYRIRRFMACNECRIAVVSLA